MKATRDPLRILLVEDDPTSRAFLTAALRALPAEVDGADSRAAALVLLATQVYDLWMFDANLPDGDGSGLLEQARRRQPDVPALAHTASNEPALLEALSTAGFNQVLVKPLPATAVRSAVGRALGLDPAAMVANVVEVGIRLVWDDDAAAAALNGNRAHVDTLRQLFLAELPHTHARILASAREQDRQAMHTDLHKLRASCGFVGAARLAGAVRALQARPDDPNELARFDGAAQDTLTKPG